MFLSACLTMSRRMIQLLRMQVDVTVLAGRIQCCCFGAEMCDKKESSHLLQTAQGNEKNRTAAMQAAHNILNPHRPRPAPTIFNAASHQAR